jgi:hypothetical protein
MREHSQIEDMRAALRGDIERARQRGEPVFQAIVEPEAEPAAVEGLEPEPEPVLEAAPEPEPVVREPEPVLDAAPEPEPVPQEPEPAVEPPRAALEEEPRPRSGLFAFFRKR